MAEPRTIGNSIAPWRFIVFIIVLVIGTFPASRWLGTVPLGIIGAFDAAAIVFLILCWRLLTIDDPQRIEDLARQNDANRTVLLVITGIVMTVLLIAVGTETIGKQTQPFDRALIIVTFVVAWLFGNTVYALHYAHMGYIQPEAGCSGFRFPETQAPLYPDFVYFAFTLGMAFATSDVIVTDQRIRKVVTVHCLAAFAFNIGVIGFTVNLLASGGG
jgi:uncharacterized membrane protein